MNLDLYENVRAVPENAKKTIQAGKLKGMTDINPMWRIKKLTECFGMCGIGWYTKIIDKQIFSAADEIVASVDVELYVKIDGEWSKPISGTGGSKLVGIEKEKPRANDEAFKMAETDAISVCCKKLGFGADVYWDKDGESKYSPPAENVIICRKCKKMITDPQQVGKSKAETLKKYNKAYILCPECLEKAMTNDTEG